MAKPFEKETYFALTLDPVHVGTGGYRLGRVDNTIIREPGTNVPKIPGSSIAGVTRAYTAMAVQSLVGDEVWEKKTEGLVLNKEQYKKMKYQRPLYKFLNKEKQLLVPGTDGRPVIERDKEEKEIYYSCAGKGVDDGEGHCGENDCPVCVSFGFSKKNSSFQGLAQFYDARILFFPVYSMLGPVWITSPSILKEHGNNIILADENEFKYVNLSPPEGKLNFGWLMLKSEGQTSLDSIFIGNLKKYNEIKEIIARLYLVSDKLFSQIVNDNLEVRTSVAINPATGAAEEGALYTYEAIPRATVMWFDVIFNKPEYFKINNTEKIIHNKKDSEGWIWIKENVEKGLKLMEYIGVGGMNTRGMGRFKILNLGGSNGTS